MNFLGVADPAEVIADAKGGRYGDRVEGGFQMTESQFT